jgi:hypothetical protein
MSIVLPMGLLVGLIAGGFRLRTPSASVTVALAKQPRLLGLLPADHEERAAFAAVAISAGVCEELIYRGFGIAYVRWLWPAATTLDICLITAIAFGLVHLYQGWRGVTMTGVFGAVFAYVVILTGSLIPAVVLHSLLDLRLLMLPSAKLAEARGLAAQEASGQESVPATSVSTAPWPPSAGVPLLPPPGWYTDPWGQAGSSGWRWWDGGHWTQYSGNDH